MFGYIRPALDRLTEEQRQAYQSVYCGLCHTMSARHGFLARFTLQYDFAFLAILFCGCGEEGERICLRCPAHPLRTPGTCLRGANLDMAADQSMILTYHKLSDDVEDNGLLAGLPYRMLRFLLRGAYRKAAAAQEDFEQQVQVGLVRLREMERVRSPELDRVADAFASILASGAAPCQGTDSNGRVLRQLLYHLGRWIYLMDAWDDLDSDRKRGRYNPLEARFQGKAREEQDYFETTATHSIRLAASAANLMELGNWKPIVENVLYSGLPAVQGAVLDGRWKEIRNTRRHPYERSLPSAGRQSRRQRRRDKKSVSGAGSEVPPG